jgi:hypothetical protein
MRIASSSAAPDSIASRKVSASGQAAAAALAFHIEYTGPYSGRSYIALD